ncbi:MAG TPA: M14 family zinc carboxypeptidase, partial [Dehalococcoidia bacterium]|nr:M14 family zinc carboxypeptidase [Dehalococcoidia bacterium]
MKKIVGILLALVVAISLVGTSAFAETEPINRDKYWEIEDIEERENLYYDMIMYSEIGAKLREIEVTSDRVKVEIIGKSGTAGYNLYQVIVSEPSALGRLGEYAALSQMMMKDPEGAQSMIEEGMDYKAPIYIYSTPHGNEAPGVDAAIMLIETLAYENTEEVMNILENCIVVVNVCANPEGRTALTRQNFAGFDM